jgi:GT2 family glycosyltransferase
MSPTHALVGPTQAVAAFVPPALPAGRITVDGKQFVRQGRRFRVQGVTYGPFAPGADGLPFPGPGRVKQDFADMRAAAINSVRVYHAPPGWLLGQADEHEMAVFVDVPWRKHLCFLESAEAQREAREAVRLAVKGGQGHPGVFAYSIGNEVPAEIVRWHGTRRVERFLRELCDVAKQADPAALVTYASFPPTEFLELPFLDFATFNVYLHDREAFRRYLFRLQNLAGDRPLLLGELGMDTMRHGEGAQAAFLAGHAREARLMGLAGMFVFAWTDDWHTGGHPVEDWAFGLTRADRTPKASYHAVREVFEKTPARLLDEAPKVSVVVCTYNGGRTLEQCLRSLQRIDYPANEVIVVDDGSTDDTREILARFPDVRSIHQANRGLSVARNVGLRAATGDVVAYTDSDCFVDPDWLTHLVYQLQRSGAHAVGGPNLTPEDGWLAACVAASPGQPTHVLESDQVAEHIPGCNMAFRRDALLAINGFDPIYRKAGDDVDVCWRLQQAGMWITFAPGAFVWHHRRQGPRSYLRQQGGYGEAEGLLYFKHPDKFNRLGDGKWRGQLYGASLQGLRLSEDIIYHGTFGTGLFQCLYQPAPAHWAMLPSTLEWHLVALTVASLALLWPWALLGAAAMLVLSVLVAALQAAQAELTPRHEGLLSRLVIAGLCYAQPLVRSWRRHRTRLLAARPATDPGPGAGAPQPLSLGGGRVVCYWTEEGYDRAELLGLVIAHLNERGWGKVIDAGWGGWDLRLHCHRWTVIEVCTTQENHGGRKRLIRARFRLRPLSAFPMATAACLGIAVGAAALTPALGGAALALGGALIGWAWWRGTVLAGRAVALFDVAARQLGLLRLDPAAAAKSAGGQA